MVDYSQFIELDNVTLQDCSDLYEKKNKITIIEDGHITGFQEEKKCV